MRPTVDEQLAGARRLVELVAAEVALPDASAARLAEAARLLRHVEASWALVLPFLAADNEGTAELLAELSHQLPEELRPSIGAELAAATPGREGLDVAAASARNRRLRALLADAVPLLGPDGRRRVARHLRRRLELDPTHRPPARSQP